MPTNPKIIRWDASKRTAYIKALIYGDSGVGKTRFACSAPAPLVLDCEQGLASVDWEVDVWPVKSWNDVRECYKFLKEEKHDYKTLVVDPLLEILKLAIDNTIATNPGVKRDHQDLPAPADWNKALSDHEKFVRSIRALPMNIICTGHPAPRAYDTDPVQPQFQGKATSNMVTRYMDIVGYMTLTQQEGGKVTNALITKRPNYVTKDRTGKLPPVFYSPTWEELTKLWNPVGIPMEEPDLIAAHEG